LLTRRDIAEQLLSWR